MIVEWLQSIALLIIFGDLGWREEAFDRIPTTPISSLSERVSFTEFKGQRHECPVAAEDPPLKSAPQEFSHLKRLPLCKSFLWHESKL